MNPILTLRKVRDQDNFIGFEVIEVLHFNYDGTGEALVSADGDLMSFGGTDLNFILFGDPGDGTVYYGAERAGLEATTGVRAMSRNLFGIRQGRVVAPRSERG